MESDTDNLVEVITKTFSRRRAIEASSSLFLDDSEDSEKVTVRPYSVRSLSHSRDI